MYNFSLIFFEIGNLSSVLWVVSLFEATLGQVPSGTCETFCQDLTLAPNGGCEVKFSIREGRRFRGGRRSCFSADFGGSCSGIDELCRIGNHVSQQHCGEPCREGKRDIGSGLWFGIPVFTSSSQEARRPKSPVIITKVLHNHTKTALLFHHFLKHVLLNECDVTNRRDLQRDKLLGLFEKIVILTLVYRS